jgi:Peptidase A4 family
MTYCQTGSALLVVGLSSMKITKLGLCATGLTIALCGIPYSMAQTAPGGNIPTVPTNLPNIRTFVQPPTTFNPVVASPEALQQHGFPPRPDQLKAPGAYSAWAKAVSAPQTRLQSPQLEQTPIFNGPAQIQPSGESKQPASEFNSTPTNAIATNSSNWSGYADYDNNTKPFAKSYIYAYWIVPVAQHAFGNSSGGWDYSSQWVGIDGYGSPDVLQAGTEVDAYASGSTTATFYAAWIEWYPFSESRISNFSVAPGNEMFVEVWNTSATVGNAYLLNVTTQQAVAFTFDAPSGTRLVGNSAEWVVERPGFGNSLATLTNYVACPFDACWAIGSVNGGTYNRVYYPEINLAGTTVFAISMLDNGGNVISIPGLVGFSDIWFRDTGSAY